jgi:hypothetical protein
MHGKAESQHGSQPKLANRPAVVELPRPLNNTTTNRPFHLLHHTPLFLSNSATPLQRNTKDQKD